MGCRTRRFILRFLRERLELTVFASLGAGNLSLGMDFSDNQVAMIAIVVAAGSEILALLPQVKANSWVQLLMSALRSMFPKR